ncbi:MAG: hypothetical protein ACRC2H_01790, partial [Silanimonas sp.]
FALELMKRVLSADPENERARAGINAIGTYFRDAASAFCLTERWSPCNQYAGFGLEALPDDPELLKLKETAEVAQRGL